MADDIKHYRVRATHDGYRCAGRAWTRAPQVVAADALSAAAWRALASNRRMLVEPVAAPANDATDKGAPTGKGAGKAGGKSGGKGKA